MAFITVGVGKDYNTISDAVSAASSDDIILIDPGTYDENLVLDKLVHLVGNTDNPENDEVTINLSDTDGTLYAIDFSYAPASAETIYIEGLYLTRAAVDWRRVTTVSTSNANLTIHFNRCKIVKGGTSNQYCFETKNGNLDELYFTNCYLERGYAQLVNTNFNNINYTQLLKCEFNDFTRKYYNCTGSPDVEDLVDTPTVNYGPAYGAWYKKYQGYFSGYVYEQGNPVQRTLYLHDRNTGALVDTTTSSGNGYYYLETTYSGEHYIVCLDAEGGESYNDLIIGNVIPTTTSG